MATPTQTSEKPLQHRSVVSSFVCKEGPNGLRVLIFRRSDKVGSYRGKWAACSGHIDPTDTSALFAARRELLEETHYSASDLSLLRSGPPFSITDTGLNICWTITPFAFQLVEASKDKDPVIDWEHTAFDWVEPDEVLRRDTVPHLGTSLSRVMVGDALAKGLCALRDDKVNGARVLATNAVRTLGEIVEEEWKKWECGEDAWNQLRLAAWHLAKTGRPSMGAAIESAVLRALKLVRSGWDTAVGTDWAGIREKEGVAKMRHIANEIIGKAVQGRTETKDRIVHEFVTWMRGFSQSLQSPLRILTLSSSSTLYACLTTAFLEMKETAFDVRILESRPRFEGASFANLLSQNLSRANVGGRINITLATDSSVALLARDVNIVLLGADRISGDGDVSNKTGSLPAALCAKMLAPDSQVVVVSELEKIAKPGKMEAHVEEDNESCEVIQAWPAGEADAANKADMTIRNVYFEWVPAKYVDLYVSENGILGKEDVQQQSVKIKEMEDEIWGQM